MEEWCFFFCQDIPNIVYFSCGLLFNVVKLPTANYCCISPEPSVRNLMMMQALLVQPMNSKFRKILLPILRITFEIAWPEDQSWMSLEENLTAYLCKLIGGRQVHRAILLYQILLFSLVKDKGKYLASTNF